MYLMFLLFFMGFSTSQAGCPIQCNCTANSVSCVKANLEHVPYFESLTNNPIIVDLSENSISTVNMDDFSFDKSELIKEIYLNKSDLISIEDKAFDELSNLQELYLGDNYLSTLPDDFITNNENLILLDLSGNYFNSMPKIKSKSLEVLAVVNTAMSEVSRDSLESLPNLRMLLLQRNNLKTLDPVIFERMPNFFIVGMAHNPWTCSCETTKLFHFLAKKGFVDLAEAIQCRTEEKTFATIYDERGISRAFQNVCSGNNDFTQIFKPMIRDLVKNSSQISIPFFEVEERQNKQVMLFKGDVFYSVILVVSIFVSLMIGVLFGSVVTRRYLLRNIVRSTSSTKELLKDIA